MAKGRFRKLAPGARAPALPDPGRGEASRSLLTDLSWGAGEEPRRTEASEDGEAVRNWTEENRGEVERRTTKKARGKKGKIKERETKGRERGERGRGPGWGGEE